MNRRISPLLILLLLPWLSAAQDPYIRHYTTNDGLPGNTITYLCTDHDHFIWMATDAGVVRYDGSRFVTFTRHDGLNSTEVIRIREDSQGRIWFLYLNGTVGYYQAGRIFNPQNARFLDQIKGKEFFLDCFEDASKTLYFVNKPGEVFTLDSANQVKHHLLKWNSSSEKAHGEVPYHYQLKSMCAMPPHGFLIWYRSSLCFLPDLESDKPELIDSLVSFFVLHMENEHYSYNWKKTGPAWLIRHTGRKAAKIAQLPRVEAFDNVTGMLVDNEGMIWIANYHEGVEVIREGKLVHRFNIRHPESIIRDHEGNIWVSTMNSGLYRINPEVLRHRYFGTVNFEGKGITALDSDPGNGIWMTNGTSVYCLADNRLMSMKTGLTDRFFSQLYRMKNGNVLVCEKDNDYYVFTGIRPDKKSGRIDYSGRIRSPGFLLKSSNQVKKLVLNRNRDKLLNFSGVAFFILHHDNPVVALQLIQAENKIYNLFFNARDEIIINSRKNLQYIDGTLRDYLPLKPIEGKIITGHQIINDTLEVITTENDSIFLLIREKLIPARGYNQWLRSWQTRYITGNRSAFFIASSSTVFRCNNILEGAMHRRLNFEPIDMTFRNIHSILLVRDSLLVASDDGLTIIPPKRNELLTNRVPLPYFWKVFINDSLVTISDKTLVLNRNKRIQIQFGAISYSDRKVSWSYRLEGVDDNWITGAGEDVVYQHLMPGKYRFLVRARNDISEWSQPAGFDLVVEAMFWQRPLFLVSVVVLLTGVATLLIILRKNSQLRKHETELQLIMLEQKALQSMMNPHFIFNALGSIQSYLLLNKSAEAGLYLSGFARLIRQNLNAINASFINISDEVDRLKNYLDLEKLRMECPFDYQILIEKTIEDDDILIPSMIVQPFVENAIWHGITNCGYKGLIIIRFSQPTERMIVVRIEDNGIGMRRVPGSPESTKSHIHMGIEMTRKRLDLLGKKYNIPTAITFAERDTGQQNPGTMVELIIPVAEP